jgi:hypothetical protein
LFFWRVGPCSLMFWLLLWSLFSWNVIRCWINALLPQDLPSWYKCKCRSRSLHPISVVSTCLSYMHFSTSTRNTIDPRDFQLLFLLAGMWTGFTSILNLPSNLQILHDVDLQSNGDASVVSLSFFMFLLYFLFMALLKSCGTVHILSKCFSEMWDFVTQNILWHSLSWQVNECSHHCMFFAPDVILHGCRGQYERASF